MERFYHAINCKVLLIISKKLFAMITLALLTLATFAQTPQFYSSTYSGGCNSWPFNASTSSGSNKCQWLFQPSQFPGAYAGNITRIYVYPCGSSGSVTYTNLIIRLGHTSLTALSSGAWITAGMQTCLSASSYAFSWTGLTWLPIVLTTPFAYNPTQNLIVEIEQDNYSGTPFTINQQTYSIVSRMYGSSLSTSSSGADQAQCDLGFDESTPYYNDAGVVAINSPTTPVNPGLNNIRVTLKNFGKINLNTATVRYSVDGVLQAPVYSWVGPLAPNTQIPTPITLGSYNFTIGSHTIKAWTQNPNGVSDSNKINDTTKVTINCCQAKFGNFTIDAAGGGDFLTFNAALNSLTGCGISGPVVFTVRAGTYNERLVIPPILGASSINTVTFRGINKSTSILTYTPSSLQSTVVFNGARYVKFDNITIQNLGASGSRAIFFTGRADTNKISNCRIIISGTNTSSNNIAIEGGATETSTGSAGNNANYDSIINCDISGGYYGVLFYGTSYSSVCYGNVIQGNTFHDQYYVAIYGYYQRNYTNQRNTIDIGGRNTSAYGIYINYCQKSIIDGNIIKPGYYGIYTYYENYYSTGDSTMIINNMISNFKNTTYQIGLYCYPYNYNLRVYHNTIWVNGSSANSYSYAAMYLYYPYNLKILNNILISTGGTMLLSIYNYTYGTAAIIDGNNYYYPGATTNMFYNYSTYYMDLNSWRGSSYSLAIPHDMNSIDKTNPNLISTTNMHLDLNFPANKTYPVGLKYDADGDPRCRFEATRGADESTYGGRKPTAGFYSDDTLCLSTPVFFLNYAGATEKVAHTWFLNGMYQTHNLNFSYTFGSVGIDTVKLVTENCYGKDTFTKVISVDSPLVVPRADFITMQNNAEIYDYVTLTDLSTGCPSDWTWEIDPDTINDINFGMVPTYELQLGSSLKSQNPVMWFDYPGKYKVCLTVSNVRGTSTRTCKKDYIEINAVGIMNCASTPDVVTSLKGTLNDDLQGAGYQNLNVNQAACHYAVLTCSDTLMFVLNFFDVKTGDYFRVFQGSDNLGKPLWNKTLLPNGLGNNMQMTSPNFQDTFISSTGSMYFEWARHNAGNTTTNTPGGFIGTWQGHKIVVSKPAAKFTGPDTVCVNENADFYNQTTGMNPTYMWVFDPMQPPITDRDASWTFLFPGTYVVKMTASNCGGDSTFEKTVVVQNPMAKPRPDFYTNLRFPLKGVDVVNIVDSTKGCVDGWKWRILPMTYTNVGGSLNTQNIRIRFDDTGCYDITLIASYNINSDSITKKCYIHAIDYCIPQVLNLNQDIGIGFVQIGTINNSTPVGVAIYTDYSSTQSAILDKRGKYLLKVGRNTTFNLMNRKVWIDYNIDGDFNDPGELVASEPSALTPLYTTNITIPKTARSGSARMRIGTSLASMPNNPCGVNTYGEFEDYRIFLQDDATPPVITLRGQDTVYIDQCSKYIDSGAVAMDNVNGNITASIVVTRFLNVNAYGTYWYKYNVQDSNGNKAAQVIRIIIVRPEKVPPQLILKGSAVMKILVGTPWLDPGFTVKDTCSGLKGTVGTSGTVNSFLIGDYVITYTATDNNNNVISIKRIVQVRDTIAPSAILKGTSFMTLLVYSQFIDPGITVFDNYDPDPILTITGTVDTAHVGTYQISYSVTDHSGNGPVIIHRTVNVIDTIKPIVTAPGHSPYDTIKVEVFSLFTEPVLNITDNYYTTFTKTVSGTFITNFPNWKPSALGNYTLILSVKDGSGNTGTISFVIKVVDTEKPVVTLLGHTVVNLCRFEVLDAADDIATVTDNYDNNPTLTRGGTYITDYLINRNKGFYKLVYSAKDGSGNISILATRMINVEDCPANGIAGNNKGTIEIYPNPNKGTFDIKIDLRATGKIRIIVMNLLGETVNEREVTGNGTYQIDLGGVNQGIYLVKVESANMMMIEKMTIAR